MHDPSFSSIGMSWPVYPDSTGQSDPVFLWYNLAEYKYLGANTVVEMTNPEPEIKFTLIKQGSEPVGDGGDAYTGLDRFGRVVQARWRKDSTATELERVEYGYDRASNRIWRDNLVASGGQDEGYFYDTLYQLKNLDRGTLDASHQITGTPVWEEEFNYDDTGNWHGAATAYLTRVNGQVQLNQNRSHNQANEITNITESQQPSPWVTPAHDAVGNLTTIPQPASPTNGFDCVWDAWNRLVRVATGAGAVGEYAYDGLMRRVSKTTAGTTRHFYYSDRWQVLEETVGATLNRHFVWGVRRLDDLIFRHRDTDQDGTLDERLYALQDAMHVSAVVNTNGTVLERYGYDAFGGGRVLDANWSALSASQYDWEVRFGGYWWDAETALYQVRFRYLHPGLGRWLSRDPLGEEGGFNLYHYALNNPITNTDPSGLKKCSECWGDYVTWHKICLGALALCTVIGFGACAKKYGPWHPCDYAKCLGWVALYCAIVLAICEVMASTFFCMCLVTCTP